MHIAKLKEYSTALRGFPGDHPITVDSGQETLDSQLLQWHRSLFALQVSLVLQAGGRGAEGLQAGGGEGSIVLSLPLQSAIHEDFDVNWSEASTFDLLSALLYIVRECQP